MLPTPNDVYMINVLPFFNHGMEWNKLCECKHKVQWIRPLFCFSKYFFTNVVCSEDAMYFCWAKCLPMCTVMLPCYNEIKLLTLKCAKWILLFWVPGYWCLYSNKGLMTHQGNIDIKIPKRSITYNSASILSIGTVATNNE